MIKLILAVLGALSKFERSMSLAPTSEGRRRAQERGVKFHPRSNHRGPCPSSELVRKSYNVSHSTISRPTISRL
jgi:DNA invertase Pin-like site-specific DNA recombinase